MSAAASLNPPKMAFNIREACAASGMGKTYLFAAIKDGRLSAVRAGGRTLIMADAMQAFLGGLPPARPILKTKNPPGALEAFRAGRSQMVQASSI